MKPRSTRENNARVLNDLSYISRYADHLAVQDLPEEQCKGNGGDRHNRLPVRHPLINYAATRDILQADPQYEASG